jgi:hypothetical protein
MLLMYLSFVWVWLGLQIDEDDGMHGKARKTPACPCSLHARHITMTPTHQQSSYCSTDARFSNIGMPRDVAVDTFPCKASAWRRATYVLSHLHLGVSSDPSMLLTQIALLAGLTLGVVDLLRGVAWGPRWVPCV